MLTAVRDRLIRDVSGWWARDYDPLPQWESWQKPHRATLPYAVNGLSAKSLYEIGCGAGPNLRLLQEQIPGISLGGSDINKRHAEWAASHLNVPIEVQPVPGPVDGSWDVTLTCYTLAYCPPDVVARQLAEIGSQYLILMEPWGEDECHQATPTTCPRWHHDWSRVAGDAGWRLMWRWPITPTNNLDSLTIFQKYPG